MHVAVESKNLKIIQLLLLKESIDVNLKDEIHIKKYKSSFFSISNGFLFVCFWNKPIDCTENKEIKQLFENLSDQSSSY